MSFLRSFAKCKVSSSSPWHSLVIFTLLLLLSSSRNTVLGDSAIRQETSSTAAIDGLPTNIGRTVTGNWRGLSFELFFYANIKELTGPQKKKQCFLDSVEAAFSDKPFGNQDFEISSFHRITDEEMARALVYASEVAAQRAMEDKNRDFRKEERKRESEDGRIYYGPIPRIEDLFRGGGQSAPIQARDGLAYSYDTNVAFYLDGKAIDTYVHDETVLSVATSKELETFMHEIAPLHSQYFPSLEVRDGTKMCIKSLGDDNIWVDADKPWLASTKIFGRKASGVWKDEAVGAQHQFEIFSFVEFFRLWSSLDDTMKECFYETVNSTFFEDYLSVEFDESIVVSDLLAEEINHLRTFSFQQATENKAEDSVYKSLSLGSVATSGFSVQHGVVINVNGTFIEQLGQLPTGFDEFSEDIVHALVATPFEVRDSMDSPYEISDIAVDGSFGFVMLLGTWMDDCQYPRRAFPTP